MLFWINHGNTTLQNSNCTDTYFLSYKPSKKSKQDLLGIVGEAIVNSESTSNGYGHTSVRRPVKNLLSLTLRKR